MPHLARRRSASGFYHVVAKGLGDQLIFEDDTDRQVYTSLLAEAKATTGIRIHAYCLMSNHVHLILEDEHGKMGDALKYAHERYATYYAKKTGRVGGIFRRPYWSEPIETDAYLLCAVRYVHANPAAAGICPASAYEWSSVFDYLGKRTGGITDTDMILSMCNGVSGFIEFSQGANCTALPFEGSVLTHHLTDEEVMRIAKDIVGAHVTSLKSLARQERNSAIHTLALRHFSRAQIARVTGLSRKEVELALR